MKARCQYDMCQVAPSLQFYRVKFFVHLSSHAYYMSHLILPNLITLISNENCTL